MPLFTIAEGKYDWYGETVVYHQTKTEKGFATDMLEVLEAAKEKEVGLVKARDFIQNHVDTTQLRRFIIDELHIKGYETPKDQPHKLYLGDSHEDAYGKILDRARRYSYMADKLS